MERAVARAVGAEVRSMSPVSGGDINDAYRVALADGRMLFVKSSADARHEMFEAEAWGLAWLMEAEGPRVPEVVAVGDSESDRPFLALEWLEPGPRGAEFDARFGRELARLHRAGAPSFGLAEDNFLATLPQDNTPEEDWPTFWARRRLEPLVRRATDLGHAPGHWRSSFESLYRRLPDLAGPVEPPARLHGDLWTGNVMADASGAPAIVDPAVYGGHREVDLAMLTLFGSPTERFFGAYDEVTPLSEGWRDRLSLWQLYPLLAHVCLFGGGYVSQVDRVLDEWA